MNSFVVSAYGVKVHMDIDDTKLNEAFRERSILPGWKIEEWKEQTSYQLVGQRVGSNYRLHGSNINSHKSDDFEHTLGILEISLTSLFALHSRSTVSCGGELWMSVKGEWDS